MHDPVAAYELPGDASTQPLESRIDSVLMTELGGVECVLAVEAQTDCDKGKREDWVHYTGYLTAKYKRPVGIIVVCSKISTAVWARKPIEIKVPGLGVTTTVQPTVFGPDNVPRVTDLAEARADVGFAVFSAIVHGRAPDRDAILETLAEALNGVDIATARRYVKIVECGLVNPSSRQKWSDLMAHPKLTYTAPIWDEARAEGRTEGKAEGKAELVLELLEDREIAVSPAERERILECADSQQLKTWVKRALTVERAEELFR